MRIALVGHGPSLEGALQGSFIDQHDYVMRFKKGWQLCAFNPKDYGAKLDFLLASTEVPGCFVVPEEPNFAGILDNIKAFIGYPKKGYYDEVEIERVERALEALITVPLNLYNYWNARFRELGATHPNVSAGMAGIIIAAHELRPKHMTLAGFDTLLDPSAPFTRIESVPRTGDGPFPSHDWAAERKLLTTLAQEYHFTFMGISEGREFDEVADRLPNRYEQYGENAEEKMLDDRQRARDLR